MILVGVLDNANYSSIPRESGDDPIFEHQRFLMEEYSPRERG